MNIYDSRPNSDALAARCRRDKINPADLVEVVAPVGHYLIRCYGLPCVGYGYDVGTTYEFPAFILYSVMRNGKISNGWGHRHPAKDMYEVNGNAQRLVAN